MDIKDIGMKIGLGMVGAALVMFGVTFVTEETDAVTAEDVLALIDIEALKGADGKDGARGYTGAKGVAGEAGEDGMTGADGADGADAEVDIDDILDELEDREAERDGEYELSGDAGNYREDIELEEEDYEVDIRHFGAEEFKVSLVDEEGDITVLVDTDGHYSDTIAFSSPDDEEYELRVSADGDWRIEFELD